MKKPSKKTIKRKLDKLISERVRSIGYCVKCKGNKNLQAAHIFSRSNLSVRWDIDNVLCLCAGCHFHAHHNPILFTEFVNGYLGKERYTNLKQRALSIRKWTVDSLIEFYKETYADQ